MAACALGSELAGVLECVQAAEVDELLVELVEAFDDVRVVLEALMT